MTNAKQSGRKTPSTTLPAGLALAIGLTSLTSGCGMMTGTVGIDSACTIFPPIQWSTQDTDETIRQVKRHNAGYDEVCP